MDRCDFWGGRALLRSRRWATTKSRWKQPPVQFWGWTFAIPNIASNLSLGPKSQGTLKTMHCCCKDLLNNYTGGFASLTARLNDKIVVDLSSEGSKEWEGKLPGCLVMFWSMSFEENPLWGFVQGCASWGPNRITVDFFANEPSKFIQLSYLGPDTGGEEWMVMPVAVLQHEPRLTSRLAGNTWLTQVDSS